MTPTRISFVPLRLALALCLAWSASCKGCHGCGKRSDLPLATVIELRGDTAQRDHAQRREHWERVDARAKFHLGDGLRTDPPSSALLALADGAELQVRTATLIRFLIDGAGDDEQGIDVQTGEALLSSGSEELRLRTRVGLAILAAGGRLLMTRQGNDLRLLLEVGEASFRNDRNELVKLAIGEGVLLKVGTAELPKPAVAAAHPEPPPEATTVAHVESDDIRMRARGEREWRALARGDHPLASGTGLRLPAGAKLGLTRGADSAELRGAGEFSLVDDTNWVEVQRGDLRIVAVASDVTVIVPGGRIVVHAADGGSNANLHISDGEGALDVERGAAAFKNASTEQRLVAGGTYHWAFASNSGPEPEVSVGPDYANFGVAAGESCVVHAPEVPVALSFDFAKKCKGEGVVELVQGRQRSRAVGHANLSLGAGTRSYAIRCIDARGVPGNVVARGTAQVLRDAGTRKLPPVAPTSEIDADGRSYTIFYQNQLPNVRLRWPNAPSATSYQLMVDGTSMSVASSEHLFQSGSLRDGIHHLNFEAEGRRSRTAEITVRFDNTAPTASLSAPIDGGFRPGDTVVIEGVALPTWKVSVQGGTIEKVGDDRFRGQVVTSEEHPDIAVRLVHPRLGTHYYLRRAAGSR
jgi:hypothetical protein